MHPDIAKSWLKAGKEGYAALWAALIHTCHVAESCPTRLTTKSHRTSRLSNPRPITKATGKRCHQLISLEPELMDRFLITGETMMATHRLALQLLPDRTPHGSIRLKVQRISIATLRRNRALKSNLIFICFSMGCFA